jgi:hypothetical protein
MKKVFKVLVIITAIFLYIAFGLSHLEIESTLFGVFWELLILPAFFLQISLTFILSFLLIKGENKLNSYTIFNFITTILLLCSFIFF